MSAQKADEIECVELVRPHGQSFGIYVKPRHRSHYEGQAYEKAAADVVKRIATRTDLFIDLGARYGFFSSLAAHQNPQLRIFAIESRPSYWQTLRQNISALDHFRIELRTPASLDALSIGGLVGDAAPGRLLVRIDVDGQELSVLRKLQATLDAAAEVRLVVALNPQILCGDSALFVELDRLGFTMFLMNHDEQLYHRVRPSSDLSRLAASTRPTNLYCVRKQRALSMLFFLHSTSLGGAERCFAELLTHLSSDPDVVCTVVCPNDGPLLGELQAIGAEIIFCAGLSWWAGAPESATQEAMTRSANTLLKLIPALRNLDPDVVYTETMVIPWGAATAALLGKPHVWSICEFGELDHGLKFLGGLDEVIQQIKDGASFILTISESVRTTLFSDLSSDRAKTIYRYSATPSVKAPPGGVFNRPEGLRLAVFGTISEGKGQLDAVKAVSRLRQRCRDAELILAGYHEPNYKKRIEDFIRQQGIEERVRLMDFIKEPYATMLAANALLVCSRNEAFGRVVVDGMKLGLPVIYSRSGGIPEIMQDGVTGLSYSPGNVEELVQCIEELADDPERAAQVGAAAKQHASAKFVCNGNQILRIFRELNCPEVETRRVLIPKHVVAAILAAHAQSEGELTEARDQLRSREMLRLKLENTLASEKRIRERLDKMTSSRSYALTQRIAHLVFKFQSVISRLLSR